MLMDLLQESFIQKAKTTVTGRKMEFQQLIYEPLAVKLKYIFSRIQIHDYVSSKQDCFRILSANLDQDDPKLKFLILYCVLSISRVLKISIFRQIKACLFDMIALFPFYSIKLILLLSTKDFKQFFKQIKHWRSYSFLLTIYTIFVFKNKLPMKSVLRIQTLLIYHQLDSICLTKFQSKDQVVEYCEILHTFNTKGLKEAQSKFIGLSKEMFGQMVIPFLSQYVSVASNFDSGFEFVQLIVDSKHQESIIEWMMGYGCKRTKRMGDLKYCIQLRKFCCFCLYYFLDSLELFISLMDDPVTEIRHFVCHLLSLACFNNPKQKLHLLNHCIPGIVLVNPYQVYLVHLNKFLLDHM